MNCFVAVVIHYNLSSIVEVSRSTHIVPRNMCRHYLLIPACVTEPKLLEFPLFPPCVSLFNDKEKREYKRGPVAFSARGREENRCVHVRLGKSEVTALTHKYISLVSASRDTTKERRGKEKGRCQMEKRKGRRLIFSRRGVRLIQRDEETTLHLSIRYISSFFFLSI